MRILILGASGFIGSHLTLFASSLGHEVIALCRSGSVTGFGGMTIKWGLGESIPIDVIRNLDCAIHLVHDFGGDAGALLTKNETLKHIQLLRLAGVKRQIFFSSYSAGIHSISLYGKTKFEIENEITRNLDVVILRPGLVVGNGGVYARMQKLINFSPIIPLPDGGAGKIPVISLEDLCSETMKVVTAQFLATREFNIFYDDMISLRELIIHASLKNNRKPVLFYFPSHLIFFCLRLLNLFRITLPINADNLKGFIANQNAVHKSTLKIGSSFISDRYL